MSVLSFECGIAKIAAFLLVFSCTVFFSGCSDTERQESVKVEIPRQPIQENEDHGEVAGSLMESEIQWKDSISKNGRVVKFFQDPAPIPDETLHYRVNEGEQLFAIFLTRFGSTWKGSVVSVLSDEPMRKFEGASADDCLAAIQTKFRFTGEIEKVIACDFP